MNKAKWVGNLLFTCGFVMMLIAGMIFIHLVYLECSVPQLHLFVILFELVPIVFFLLVGLIMMIPGLSMKAKKVQTVTYSLIE